MIENLLFMKVKKLIDMTKDIVGLDKETIKKKMDYSKTLAMKPDSICIEVWINAEHEGGKPYINIDQVAEIYYADWRKMKMVAVRLIIKTGIRRIDLIDTGEL